MNPILFHKIKCGLEIETSPDFFNWLVLFKNLFLTLKNSNLLTHILVKVNMMVLDILETTNTRG